MGVSMHVKTLCSCTDVWLVLCEFGVCSATWVSVRLSSVLGRSLGATLRFSYICADTRSAKTNRESRIVDAVSWFALSSLRHGTRKREARRMEVEGGRWKVEGGRWKVEGGSAVH